MARQLLACSVGLAAIITLGSIPATAQQDPGRLNQPNSSQPPAPSARPSQRSEPPGNSGAAQQQASADQRGTPQSPAIVQILPTPKTQEEAAKEQHDQNAQTTEQRWTIGIGVATAVILFLQLFVFGRQALRLKETIHKMDEISLKQTADMQRSIDIAAATLAANKIIERAYVAISHNPPGVDISNIAITKAGEEHFGGWQDASVRFGIKNHGETPATITDIALNHFVGPTIPAVPTGPGTGERLFLVKGDIAFDSRHFQLRNVDVNQLGLTLRLWMLGYVDYIDAFGARRRAGYARVYDPSIDQDALYTNDQGQFDAERYARRNNLPFVTDPGYNYDRPRKKNEGNDWDEPAE